MLIGGLFVFLLTLPGTASAAENPDGALLHYGLEISFIPKSSLIKGVVRISAKKNQELKLEKGSLRLLRVTLDREEVHPFGGDDPVRILPSRDGILEIEYEGVFREAPSGFDSGESSVISEKGIFLIGAWYPKPEQACRYHLTAALPEGYEAVSEAETIRKTQKGAETIFAFDFPHPLESLTFVATKRYRVERDHWKGVDIFAYFFTEDERLTKTYLEQAKHFLKRYDSLITPFPYKRFSIVENFLPTGYSMPTYTLLGQQVVRLPFIPEISLGHEILHQWFGNLVYIDYPKGNWAEGLTVFLADHLYEEEKGRGFEYRKGQLVNYQSYVNVKNEFPLRDFRERRDYASEAIGYGKAMMVFRMLKDLVGKEKFYQSLRDFTQQMRFRRASWSDIQRTFERHYQKSLSGFFHQWVDESGLPDIRLGEVNFRPSGADFVVALTLQQQGKAYILDLPVALYTCRGKREKVFHLSEKTERFEMTVEDLPERAVVDEDYAIARTLSINEFPPVIARLVGDEKRIIVLPRSRGEVYEEIIKTFKEKGDRVSEPDSFDPMDRTDSLIILEADNPATGKLYGYRGAEGGFSLVVKKNPWNPWKVAGIFNARSREEVEAAFPKIFHYGKYSQISFDHGTNIHKKTDQSTRGLAKEVLEETTAVDLSGLTTLAHVIDRVGDKKFVYVGEAHDQFSNHVMELEIIKGLKGKGKNLAIGMEMFQKPFQKVVDEYIEGKIDEREFLKGTEYFKRWGFDYELYRPILLYARAERIPVVALNQRQETVDRVFKNGLDSLSEEERKRVPSGMDFSDEAYKERLKKIFGEHEGHETRSFDFFYQAQILWDETMAESADQYLRAHPDHQMVVLAGSGHLAHGSGIPKRVARRNGHDYAIVLNGDELEKGIADYVLFPGAIRGPTSPKLMVFVREEKGKVEITGFPPESVSEAAGMRAGDFILSIDQAPVRSIDDMKIDLLSKRKGEKVTVRVSRKGFFGGKEMKFEVDLR